MPASDTRSFSVKFKTLMFFFIGSDTFSIDSLRVLTSEFLKILQYELLIMGVQRLEKIVTFTSMKFHSLFTDFFESKLHSMQNNKGGIGLGILYLLCTSKISHIL